MLDIRYSLLLVIAFSSVDSCSSNVMNNSNRRAPVVQLVYKRVIEMFKGSKDADASM
ncbi:27936_t:CDS:2 [Gigaspora margarita]|uniref:27936_t:CDS:1 n=1 Tax=Gigaspora margarita TaxID=4874 RepID=A0ABM8W3U0_GIGMA|nr:27936_t:CDS:2 [Gigaspora margarita]